MAESVPKTATKAAIIFDIVFKLYSLLVNKVNMQFH